MSLVNDMLRDLAARQQAAERPAQQDNETLLQASSLLKNKRFTWLPSLIVFVITACTILLIQQLFWSQTGLSKTSLPVSNVVNENLSVSEDVQPHLQQTVVMQAAETTVRAEQQSLTTLDASTFNTDDNHIQQQIYILLQKAERALTLARLTSPVEDNAYAHYHAILKLSPTNRPAQEGLTRIAQGYIDFAQDAYARGNLQQVETLLQRAEFVAPDYSPIAMARQQLLARVDAPAIAVEAMPPVENRAVAVIANTPTASIAVSTLEVADVGSGEFEIKTNPAWQDQQAVAQAELLLSQGQVQAAQLLLQKFVSEHEQPRKATQLLFGQYMQQGGYDAARLLLQQAHDYLPAAEKTRMTAQLLMAQGHHDAAISALEKNVEQAEQDESYRALLAGLYHKSARYQESANSYRRLLDVFGEKPAYWLGLALALDALEQNPSALEAYRRVGLHDAQPQVKDYVEQRIAALSH